MIYYAVNKDLDGNKIIKDIGVLISKYSPTELSNKVLVVKLENVNDYIGDSFLPKLTYNKSCQSENP